jgi:hypothetical protein
MTGAPGERRALGLVTFSIVCLALAFAWDVAFGVVSDHALRDAFAWLPWWLPFFVAPALSCVVAGFFAGQWRADRSGVAQAGAAAWCVVAPVVVFFPFFAFMCFAFNSCIG